MRVMCYLASWDPVEYPLVDFLKTMLLDLEVAIMVGCSIFLFPNCLICSVITLSFVVLPAVIESINFWVQKVRVQTDSGVQRTGKCTFRPS